MLDKGSTAIKGALERTGHAAGLLERERRRLLRTQPAVCEKCRLSHRYGFPTN